MGTFPLCSPIMIASRLVYFDTEFSTLASRQRPELLSLGAVLDAGAPSFYREAEEFDFERLSDFTRKEVLPLMRRGEARASIAQIAEGFRDFCEAVGEGVALACDSGWDWSYALALFSGSQELLGSPPARPERLPYWPRNLAVEPFLIRWGQLPERVGDVSRQTREDYFATRHAHHALVDAEGIRLSAQAAWAAAGTESWADRARLFGVDPEALAIASAPAARPPRP
jgi:hypothetical protein